MPIIDLHCDTILKLMEDKEKSSLFSNEFSVDIEKLKSAPAIAQFFALFVYLKKEEDPMEMCLDMVDKFYVELQKNKDHMKLATNYQELVSNEKENKISAFLTIEEGAAIKGRLENLRNFYRLGVRLITLTWNFPNEFGYPNHKWEFQHKGLTDFGKTAVKEMNDLGMIIDVSHLSDGGFYDVAALSSKPFVASHSNARAVKNHSRNLDDNMIKMLSEKGGVMGINYESSFVGESEVTYIEGLMKHIDHIRNVGGIEVISLGSDFDGIGSTCEIGDVGESQKLIHALKGHNYSEDDIDRICYKNALRVIKDTMK